jgi:acyl-CoA thioester hydrolase
MSRSESGAIDVWRGTASAWECDEMGHLNVRFHVARAMEGLVGLATALGLPHAFAPGAELTIQVMEHHIRFHREVRPGVALHMTASVIDFEKDGARFLQTLIDSASGQTCANFLTRAKLVSTHDWSPRPWPAYAAERAGPLQSLVPENAGSKGLDGGALSSMASQSAADALNVPHTGRGAIFPPDCDVFGRMRTEMVIGRINAGIPHLVRPIRDAIERDLHIEGRVGGAALEYRLAYFALPRCGDQIVLRSGISKLEPKRMLMNHWLIDPISGAAWASAQNISVNLNLDTRKSIVMRNDFHLSVQGLVQHGMAM